MKLALFDIDGTFRDEAKGIPGSARLAVKLLKSQGCLTGICTGRSLGTIQEDVMSLPMDCLIAGGGSYIRFGNRILKNCFFPEETIAAALSWISSHPEAGCSMETEEQVFMDETAAKLLTGRNEKKWRELTREEAEERKRQEKIRYEPNMKAFHRGKYRVHKISLWLPESGREAARELTERSEIYPAQEDVWMDGWFYEELIQTGCDKGSAVFELCRFLGIPPSETISFGDGKNDIDMLKATGCAVAMKNSHRELLPYADSICGAPAEDGIYKELIRRNIIQEGMR